MNRDSFKTLLQKLCNARGWPLPTYDSYYSNPQYFCSLIVNKRCYIASSQYSEDEAEEEAASEAYRDLS
ncbi:hypothetical protein EV44_g6142 [Erysiphe necator]|uniref:DRBM domain-containing protein n=1 Tax=Uncinula necator TaxID=52586 RepID=A0A0B1P6B0_UNCNE|nr:hypothetical protein EV44_g6142 [Erysiphe necator]